VASKQTVLRLCIQAYRDSTDECTRASLESIYNLFMCFVEANVHGAAE
jgi:hypothetical protein